jgi:ferredoxin-type protein NapH
MKPLLKTRQKVHRGVLIASLALFPVTFSWLSPAVPLQAAVDGVLAGSLIVFALLFLQSLLLGRLFCGWACPAGGLQELTALVRTGASTCSTSRGTASPWRTCTPRSSR